MKRLISQQGMTLVELLVAMTLTAIISVAMFNAFASQSTTYADQEQIVGMQQSLRAGFDLLTREVRMAGYNPARNVGIGWVTADPSSIVFSTDLNENGSVVAEPDEYVTYALFNFDGKSSLGRKGSSTAINFSAVAENIVALGFAYAVDSDEDGQLDTDAGKIIWAVKNGANWFDLDVDDDGQITVADDTNNDGIISGEDTGIVADVADIRAVRIWMLAKTGSTSRKYYEGRSFVVGNQIMKPNDKNRYRLLTSIERCRNTGL